MILFINKLALKSYVETKCKKIFKRKKIDYFLKHYKRDLFCKIEKKFKIATGFWSFGYLKTVIIFVNE